MDATTASKILELHIDESGSRNPDHVMPIARNDRMDCFALGGILIREEDKDPFLAQFRTFVREWELADPLHSHEIRSRSKRFAWLGQSKEAEGSFLDALTQLIERLPFLAIACVVHRPGYVQRYATQYEDRLWLMCKTAFSILVERSARFAFEEGRRLRVNFEECGRKEDRDLIEYMRELKATGMPFVGPDAKKYPAMTAAEFSKIVAGPPRRATKASPFCQLADLILYPVAKAGYDQSYRPFDHLRRTGKLIDVRLSSHDAAMRGIKYSCFDALGAANQKTSK